MPGSVGDKLAKCSVQIFQKLCFFSFFIFSSSHCYVHVVVKTDRGDRSCTDPEDVRSGEWKGKEQ